MEETRFDNNEWADGGHNQRRSVVKVPMIKWRVPAAIT
jgi:hypothetical protein